MNKLNQPRKSNKNKKKYPPDPNKSDEQIVNEYKHLLNCDVNTLAVNSETTRRHEYVLKNKIKIPPRPLNAFFLYRRDLMNSPEFKDRPAREKKAEKISKEISERWNNVDDETKNVFHALARIANKKHKEIYKNYKFIRKVRKTQKTENVEEPYMSSHSFQTETSPGLLQFILPSSTNPTPSNLVQDCDSISSLNLVNDQQYLLLEDQVYILPTSNLNPNFDTSHIYEGIKLANTSQETYNNFKIADTLQTNNDFGLANDCQTYDNFGLAQQLYNRFGLENIFQQTSDNFQLTDNELSYIYQSYDNFEIAENPEKLYNELLPTLQTYDSYELTNQPYNGFDLENIHQTDDRFELLNDPQKELSNALQAYDANTPHGFELETTSMMILN